MLDVSPEQLDFIKSILHNHFPECQVLAFGSRTDGRSRPTSDLDIILVSAKILDRSRLNRLEEAFEFSDLHLRVDVLDWNRLDKSFQERIQRQHHKL
jgi:predicted nucleotidyltransferase